ncbi:MAG TPA: GDP-mannose 4,6-dehydratase [Syntrophorhabdales bacterium]|nr:GDP-mannose 4,6-dehydratase [Syntrophorhabdales bacterium]
MKRALITGITGQDGAYLAQLLLEKGYTVVGLTRNASHGNLKNLTYLSIDGLVEIVETNLLDLSNIIRLLEKYEPDEIYNLAAQSSVGLSFDQPIGTLGFNITSTANLLEAMRILHSKARFYQASSSEMFGKVPREELPIHEEFSFHPVSPYGISKATAHWVTVNYREAYGLFAVCGILFNHESALREKNFVTKKILSTSVRISRGMAEYITLGNLSVCRDWGYTPEYIRAMWMMLQQDRPEDYIICSGEPHSLEEFATAVFTHLHLEPKEYIRIDEGLYRPVELNIIYGDNSRARDKLGWHYDISFDQFIDILIKDEAKYLDWELSHQ